MRRPRQHVAGELLDRELVVRHVGVDRGNHPIAIATGKRPRAILLVAVAVGIAGQVEPVPPPALAEMRRSQQPIDEPLDGIGLRVAEKRGDFVGRRRQADQVEIEPPQQRRLAQPAATAARCSCSSAGQR